MLRVVTWHRVGDPDSIGGPQRSDPALYTATPEDFRNQVEYIAERFRVVSAEEVVEALDSGSELSPNSVLLTFDDAYRDFAEIAWPVLRSRGLPAVVFVATAHADRPESRFWWDRVHGAVMSTDRPELVDPSVGAFPLVTPADRRAALSEIKATVKRLPHGKAVPLVDRICETLGEPESTTPDTLSWDELRRLSREGVCVGAHTRTHPVLPNMERDAMVEEVRRSVDDVRRELDPEVTVFSYPYGAHDDEVVAAVREAGARLAVTTIDGYNDLHSVDPLRLRRTNVTRRTSPLLLRIRMMPWFPAIDRWRHRHQQEVWNG